LRVDFGALISWVVGVECK